MTDPVPPPARVQPEPDELEWAIIGYDKHEQCEFIDSTPDDREEAIAQLRRYCTGSTHFAALYADARVVCRTVSEWRTPTDEEGL